MTDFSKILRTQVGKLYHQYISKAENGVLNNDEKMMKFTESLKNRFDTVKNLTKARLRKDTNGKPSKSRKPRDHHEKPINKMLDRKYLRLKYFSYMSG